jgi:hypothetical protein
LEGVTYSLQGGNFTLLPAFRWTERRRKERTQLEIKSLEDARRLVQIVSARNVENNSRLRAWRIAKQATWLLLLVVAFLVYYLLDVLYEVMSLR